MAKFRVRSAQIEAARVRKVKLGNGRLTLTMEPQGWLLHPSRIKKCGYDETEKHVIIDSWPLQQIAKEGDWIIQDSNGDLQVLSDKEFKLRYEPVPESPSNSVAQCQAADGDQATLESLATDAFEFIKQAPGVDWKSKRWKLVFALTREFRMNIDSDNFLDAIGLLLDSLESRLFKQKEQPSPEARSNSVEPTSESSSDEPLYYLQNRTAGLFGNSPFFRKKGGIGYTVWITQAEKFTAKQARDFIRSTLNANAFVAWDQHIIESIADKVVDVQELQAYQPTIIDKDDSQNEGKTDRIIGAGGPTN